MTGAPPHVEPTAPMTPLMNVTAPARRRARITPLAFLLLLAPVTSGSQPRRGCPQFARVPGYGACTNTAGASCGFCTYRCNDDTVVRWNVCGQ